MSMEFERKLPSPEEVKDKFPVPKSAKLNKEKVDEEIRNIFSGKSKKLLLVIGPSSADNRYSVLDYCHRLAMISEIVKEKLLIIPRVYTSKPVSEKDGYKEMIFRDDKNGRIDAFKGIIYPRALYQKILIDTGMPAADELLYPGEFMYFDDLISYAAVSARSVENQEQRIVSSGIDIPVGMKNPKSGNLDAMLSAVECARSPHTFVYRDWQVTTSGNPFAHMVLRGFTDRDNNSMPNYDQDDLIKLYVNAKSRGLNNPMLIIDANHSNSNKNPLEQGNICRAVMKSADQYSDVRTMLKGFMVESYLEDGRQRVDGGVYGKSITDACLGWEKTEKLIFDLADML